MELAWDYVIDLFNWDRIPNGEVNGNKLREAVVILNKNSIVQVLPEWFFQTVQEDLCRRVAPCFWIHFQSCIEEKDAVDSVGAAFGQLFVSLEGYLPCLGLLQQIQRFILPETHTPQQNLYDAYKRQLVLLIKANIFFKGSKHYHEAVFHFYSQAFKAFDYNTKIPVDLDDSEIEEETDALTCRGCEMEKDACKCQHILKSFHALNSKLSEFDLLERISGEPVTHLINQRIKHHVEYTCRGKFETQYMDRLEQWLSAKVVGWLEQLYFQPVAQTSASTSSSRRSSLAHNPIDAHKGRLFHYMFETYANIRIHQLFNIIIEYPESEPALIDLKACLEKTNLRQVLVRSLKNALETRLLHPGVNTADILTAYISAIRALRVLDPTGVLLDLVCEPVRKYLRNREDTVRCIVSSLTEDGSNELSDELHKGHSLILDESYHSDEETEDWESWQPDPIDADSGKASWSRRTSDIISMLVNIYGSKELFVNEYRTLLADRILSTFQYDTDKEIFYLELLKRRFGESQLHLCEVMLKDVADSRRINSHIQEERNKQPPPETVEEVAVNAMVLSAQFWPSFREENVELPQVLQDSLSTYTKYFEALKGNRTLSWKPHLGLVSLEIEIKGKKLEMNVSPVHATIIWHFQEKDQWTVEDLSQKMHMPAHALRRKIAFWQSHGLLCEDTTDTFSLVEEHKGRGHDSLVLDEMEEESAMATAQDQREEELQMIWSYVVGMLTNLESLPLERIHSMLKMFAVQGPGSECSIQELKGFLDKKVKDQMLVFISGVYRLPKPGS